MIGNPFGPGGQDEGLRLRREKLRQPSSGSETETTARKAESIVTSMVNEHKAPLDETHGGHLGYIVGA